MVKGYVQIYTGNGKGKTTAALGLTLRCLCAGNKVFFGQFMKGQEYSELKATTYFEGLVIEQFGDLHCIQGNPSQGDYMKARKGLERMKTILSSAQYDLVVFDEIITCLFFELVSANDLLEILHLKPKKTEVVLTGRYAPKELIDRADLVTEMKEIKHYYNDGVQARVGIEK